MFAKVGDFLQRLNAIIWAIGGAVVLVGILRGVFRDIPLDSLLMIGVGTLLMLLAAIRATAPFVGRLMPTPVREAQVAVSNTEESFDPYRYMFAKIMRVDFSNLWSEHAPHIDFIVYVQQRSDWLVKLTDIRGRVRIAGNDCSLPAHLAGTHPLILRDPRSFYGCTVRQPLTQEMAAAMAWNPGTLHLRNEDARVQVSLSGLTWVGTVELPQGESALPDRVVCDEEFVILGPISEVDADKVFVRGGIFLSSQVWRHHDSGLLRAQE